MSTTPTATPPEKVPAAPSGPPTWMKASAKWIGIGVLVVVVLVAAALLVPGWWADFVGGRVQGVPGVGTFWGLAIGAVGTVLVVAAVFLALARLRGRARLVAWVVAALALLPNLLTLVVSTRATDRLRAARDVLAIAAPNFAVYSLVGALAVLVLGIGAIVWVRLRRRERTKIATARVVAGDVGERVRADRERERGTLEPGPDGIGERPTQGTGAD